MGPNRQAAVFNCCPVGTVLSDSVASMLAAYNVFKTLGELPPGRKDPRVFSAFLTIENEYNKIKLETT